eukprot:gnl/Chilomastix_caulleri/2938.p1 GENE.gnl/Chilomastix_caulleri/2938~~gnl/Chilomastix_caulleri/2938.p1  ORF type:complete len:112 (+),score=16.52 gnl/Chilomastix_caulleri/2938:53-388(+)
MGSFSYLCNGCKKGIVPGEKAVLIHMRQGEVLGRAEGTYDDYGRIREDPVFRRTSEAPNSHEDMCESEFEIPNSGIEAWHCLCYKRASHEELEAHTVSKMDPDQGFGDAMH